MLFGLSFVEFDREFSSKDLLYFKAMSFSSSNVVVLGRVGGAIEKSAALKVATRIFFSVFG